ncbi:alpha/beta hydrolase [Mycobacterium sp. IDR2000157661]|uniref:alpha/beta hydrolase n=1 Tax=Mycobacterium sp. IDR2000157661 TaxID=2867005 RepID=UPI001EEC46BF|nr:alpha/beta hydrolase [Mycobacterium sp. IDR2000157661]ULE32912.1 alpha/beta hydrolase [Mycobacterium sp. IDR2000157661]
MAVDLRGVSAVLLPGTGSDDDFVYRAFSAALHDAGAVVVTPAPQPHRLVAGYRDALGEAALAGPIAVGGVSIGAAVAVEWALAHPGRAVAVLAALPAWTGSPQWAPAAAAARHSAQMLRRHGLAAATAAMRAGSPQWLADELARSWLGQWPALPEAMEEAAGYVAPSCAELARLAAPMGVVAAIDDPVHPAEVAAEWVAAAPLAALRTVTLADLGADPAVLGAACLAALRDVAG